MKTVKVTLNQPHTHDGVDYPAGAQIEVGEADAKWLADHGVTGSVGKAPAEETKA